MDMQEMVVWAAQTGEFREDISSVTGPGIVSALWMRKWLSPEVCWYLAAETEYDAV
ncbi:MAG: hypothetical protein ACLUDL_21050 [Eubacterium callanderi]|uniref:hypothetical protein n=1 Tax=Eubacterium callanderi TaxID=53442 RepID=UPI0039956A09